jgi:ABC-type bacteriocin/lantibiotic exporter with double-glycine peptidase domain
MSLESKAELIQKFLESKASLEIAHEHIPSEAKVELLNMERIKTVRTGALLNTLKICGILVLFLALISLLSFNFTLLASGTVALLVLAVVIFRSWAATCTRCKNDMTPRHTKRGGIKYDFCKRCYTYAKVVRDMSEGSHNPFGYDERLPPS